MFFGIFLNLSLNIVSDFSILVFYFFLVFKAQNFNIFPIFSKKFNWNLICLSNKILKCVFQVEKNSFLMLEELIIFPGLLSVQLVDDLVFLFHLISL